MYEGVCVNIKVEPRSTLAFTCDTSYFASVSFTGVKFTWRSTLSLLATRREDDDTKRKKLPSNAVLIGLELIYSDGAEDLRVCLATQLSMVQR